MGGNAINIKIQAGKQANQQLVVVVVAVVAAVASFGGSLNVKVSSFGEIGICLRKSLKAGQ